MSRKPIPVSRPVLTGNDKLYVHEHLATSGVSSDVDDIAAAAA